MRLRTFGAGLDRFGIELVGRHVRPKSGLLDDFQIRRRRLAAGESDAGGRMEESVDGDRLDQVGLRDRRRITITERRPLDRIENINRE